MESSGSSSSVNDPQMEVDPVEVDVDDVNLERMSKDLLRVHVRLIMAGVLTMEESKPTLHRAFGALRGPDLEIEGDRLSRACDRLERLLEDREEAKSATRDGGRPSGHPRENRG